MLKKRHFQRNLPDNLKEGDIVHFSSGQKIEQSVLEKFITFPDVLYVGESHSNLAAHQIQLKLLKAFHAKFGSNTVIGMEMFARPYQSVLNDWISGKIDEKALLKKTNWNKEWRFDFRLYRSLWNYAKDNNIPIIALNVSRKLRKIVSSKGLPKLSSEDKRKLPEIELSDPYHRLYLEKIFSFHQNNKFDRFYQVQCLWEDFMAESISKYLSGPEGQGKKMIVFLGNGHIIYDFGVPKRAFRRTNMPYFTVYTYELTENPEEFDPILIEDIPLEPSDFLAVIPFEEIKEEHGVLGALIDLTDDKKVRIIKVHKGSPAAKAGLKEKDIITHIDKEEVTALFDVIYTLKLKNPSQSCLLTIVREGRSYDITVDLFPWKYKRIKPNP